MCQEVIGWKGKDSAVGGHVALSNRFKVDEIGYDELCNFLYMRERMEKKIEEMSEFLESFDRRQALDLPSIFTRIRRGVVAKHVEQQGSLSSSDILGCRFPQCFICRAEFVNCQHLCARCRVTLNDMGESPCPSCNKGNHMLFAQDEQQAIYDILSVNLDEFEEEPDESRDDWLPFYSHEKGSMQAAIQRRTKIIQYFVDWFNETYPPSGGHQLITVRKTMNCFTSSFLSE